MLKYIGLGAVMAVTSAFGIMLAAATGKRVEELTAAIRMISEIETKIRFQQTELRHIIEALAGNTEYVRLKFLSNCAEYSKRESFEDAFERSAEEARTEMSLNDGDWSLISSFARSLGATDIEGQLTNCRAHKELLSERLTAAKAEKSEKSRLYISLGIFSGLTVSILLF